MMRRAAMGQTEPNESEPSDRGPEAVLDPSPWTEPTRADGVLDDGVLVIDVIDRDRLDVRASGSFTAAGRTVLERRLERLVACGIRHLRVDFGDAVLVEPEAGEVFLEARARFGRVGGTLRLVNVSQELGLGLRWREGSPGR